MIKGENPQIISAHLFLNLKYRIVGYEFGQSVTTQKCNYKVQKYCLCYLIGFHNHSRKIIFRLLVGTHNNLSSSENNNVYMHLISEEFLNIFLIA